MPVICRYVILAPIRILSILYHRNIFCFPWVFPAFFFFLVKTSYLKLILFPPHLCWFLADGYERNLKGSYSYPLPFTCLRSKMLLPVHKITEIFFFFFLEDWRWEHNMAKNIQKKEFLSLLKVIYSSVNICK